MKRHYRRHARKSGALSPLAIAGICVAAVILITVILGNLLTLWLDEETYNRLTAGETQEEPPAPLHKTDVSDINAYPHVLGNDPASVIDFPAVSVSLNNPDGSLNYISDVSIHQNLTGNSKVSLPETMQALSLYSSYISAVFYPQAFSHDTSDLRFAATASESALLREFMKSGAKDLVLVDLPLESVALSEILQYVQTLKNAVGELPVGVAVPLSLAKRADGWELLNTLLETCDFCLLDLRQVPLKEDGSPMSSIELLADADYFLTQYDMRLMLTDQQSDLRSEIELRMLADFQIVK